MAAEIAAATRTYCQRSNHGLEYTERRRCCMRRQAQPCLYDNFGTPIQHKRSIEPAKRSHSSAQSTPQALSPRSFQDTHAAARTHASYSTAHLQFVLSLMRAWLR